MSVSRFNNWNAPLAGFGSPGDNFNGSPEATGAAACISVVILCSTQTTLKVEQNRSINNPFIFENEYTIQPGVQTTIQVRVVLPYFRVNIINDTMTTQTYMNMNTMLLAELTRNVDIRPLTAATDSANTSILLRSWSLATMYCSGVEPKISIVRDVNVSPVLVNIWLSWSQLNTLFFGNIYTDF